MWNNVFPEWPAPKPRVSRCAFVCVCQENDNTAVCVVFEFVTVATTNRLFLNLDFFCSAEGNNFSDAIKNLLRETVKGKSFDGNPFFLDL